MLVDSDLLTAYAGDTLPGAGPLDVERTGAGHSNLTYVVRRAPGHEWILRRPPRGPLLPTAHDVIREYRVLELLAGVRAPQPVLACADPAVIGAPFYLMERVRGEVIRETLPEWAGPAERAVIGAELVDALAELHALPAESFVAAGIGKPDGYLERQLRRWRGQREGAKVRELPDYDVLSGWLEEHLPPQARSSLVHGDYKLDNVVFDGPRLAAILDWEMATVGDPLADLGYLVALWQQVDLIDVVTDAPGFLSAADLVARYADRTGTAVTPETLTPYVVLALWKLAILLEASYSRHLAGTTDDPFFALLDRGVPALLARARQATNE